METAIFRLASFPLTKLFAWQLAGLTLLLSATQPVAAIETVEIRLGQLSGADWRIEDLRLRLALSTQADSIFTLSVGRLVHPALPHDLVTPRMTCRQGRISDQVVRCDQGTIHLDTPLLEAPEQPFAFVWKIAERRLSLNFPGLGLAAGQLALTAELQADSWRLRGKGQRLDLQQAADGLGGLGLELPAGELGGYADLRFDVAGDGAGIQSAEWRVRLHDFAFSDPDADYAGAGLAGVWQGRIARQRTGLGGGHLSLRLDDGEILTPAFYLAPDEQPIKLHSELEFPADLTTLAVRRLTFEYPGIAAFEAQGKLQLSPQLKPLSFDLSSSPLRLDRLFSASLQPVLTASFFEQLELQGQAKVAMSLSPHPSLTVELIGVGIRQGTGISGRTGGNIAMHGMNGELHWVSDGDSPASHLSWDGGRLFGGIEFGPAELALKLTERGLRLQQPARLPLLDGALQAEQFELEQTEKGPKVVFRGYLTPISMGLFSQAVGWPALAGQISGMIPGVSLQEGVLQVDGVMLVRLFGGRILIRGLRLDEIFGALPILSAAIELHDLDLETLTSTFSFGRITGKLEGRVDGLRLEDWRPVAFDARFATPPDDDSRHRISQQAVDNISNLGGAGVAGAISRSFLRFFEEFGYDRLGISCRLADGVCQMGGIAPAPSGYYLVKGGGIPRIDIIGFNRRTDWKVLIDKLQQITEGGAPVVE